MKLTNKLPKNLSMLLLGIWLILEGLIQLLSFNFLDSVWLMAIIRIV